MNDIAVLCTKKEQYIEELKRSLMYTEQLLHDNQALVAEIQNTYPDSLEQNFSRRDLKTNRQFINTHRSKNDIVNI